ncbi:hypothetical protein quinque_000035, partial [Culex quinquefasciatus]
VTLKLRTKILSMKKQFPVGLEPLPDPNWPNRDGTTMLTLMTLKCREVVDWWTN